MSIAETSKTGKGARFEITVQKGAYRFVGTGEKSTGKMNDYRDQSGATSSAGTNSGALCGDDR